VIRKNTSIFLGSFEVGRRGQDALVGGRLTGSAGGVGADGDDASIFGAKVGRGGCQNEGRGIRWGRTESDNLRGGLGRGSYAGYEANQ